MSLREQNTVENEKRINIVTHDHKISNSIVFRRLLIIFKIFKLRHPFNDN